MHYLRDRWISAVLYGYLLTSGALEVVTGARATYWWLDIGVGAIGLVALAVRAGRARLCETLD
jgi:hypothetical protein